MPRYCVEVSQRADAFSVGHRDLNSVLGCQMEDFDESVVCHSFAEAKEMWERNWRSTKVKAAGTLIKEETR